MVAALGCPEVRVGCEPLDTALHTAAAAHRRAGRKRQGIRKRPTRSLPRQHWDEAHDQKVGNSDCGDCAIGKFGGSVIC